MDLIRRKGKHESKGRMSRVRKEGVDGFERERCGLDRRVARWSSRTRKDVQVRRDTTKMRTYVDARVDGRVEGDAGAEGRPWQVQIRRKGMDGGMEEGLAVGKVGPRGPGASVPSQPNRDSFVSTTVRRAGDVRIESSFLTPSSVRPCNVRASSSPPACPIVLFFVLSRFSVFLVSFVSMTFVD